MRHKSIINLSRDHHHGLRLAQLIKKNAPVYKNLPNTTQGKIEYTLNAYKAELLPHFKKEEDILFPFVEARDDNLKELVNQLKEEHKKISVMVSEIASSDSAEKILNGMGNLLTEHIRKEERKLFEQIQNTFMDEELEKLDNLLT